MYLINSVIYIVFLCKTKMDPIVKHWQNIGNPSFQKLTIEITNEAPSGLRLVCHLRLLRILQFWRIVQTKNWPSSIQIKIWPTLRSIIKFNKYSNYCYIRLGVLKGASV